LVVEEEGLITVTTMKIVGQNTGSVIPESDTWRALGAPRRAEGGLVSKGLCVME
jgi:hypothetical protein